VGGCQLGNGLTCTIAVQKALFFFLRPGLTGIGRELLLPFLSGGLEDGIQRPHGIASVADMSLRQDLTGGRVNAVRKSGQIFDGSGKFHSVRPLLFVSFIVTENRTLCKSVCNSQSAIQSANLALWINRMFCCGKEARKSGAGDDSCVALLRSTTQKSFSQKTVFRNFFGQLIWK